MRANFEPYGEKWGAGRHRRGHFGLRGFFGHGGVGGPGGMGADDILRAKRILAQGDLRLIALALIAEQPRHGYEIIKLFEEKTGDWYSPMRRRSPCANMRLARKMTSAPIP